MIAAYAAAKPVLQRKCACGGKSRCPACEARKRLGTDLGLQPRSAPAQDGAATAEAAQSLVQGTLRGPGQPLDRATRLAMEPLFGHDFGRVRVHADAQAQASAQAATQPVNHCTRATPRNMAMVNSDSARPVSSGG